MAEDRSPLRSLSATLVAAVLMLAACSGSPKQSAPTTETRSSVPKPLAPVDCASLRAADVTRVTGITPVRKRGLARFPGTPRLCGTIYFDGTGSLLVQITEDSGGAATLRRLRAAAEQQVTRAEVRAAPAFGPGAFLARSRILAFAHNGRVVTLQTGYQQDGRLSLTVSQLTRLGRFVAGRA